MVTNKYDISYEDGSLILKEYKTVRKISLNSLAKKIIAEKKEFITPFLPDNCFLYRQRSNYIEYLLKIPKGTYNIKYSPDRRIENTKTYILTMPLQIFYFRFPNIHTVQPTIKKLLWVYDDKNIDLDAKIFFKPAISNIYNDCNICMGSIPASKTQHEYMNNFLYAYFDNVFNDDLRDGKISIAKIAKEQTTLYKAGDLNYEDNLCNVWRSDENPYAVTEPLFFSDIVKEDY